MNRRMGERRNKPRFEIVGGDLWGRLDANATLVLRNIGRHGALVQASAPLSPGSSHILAANIDGVEQQLHVRVTHCTPDAVERGVHAVGIEFVNVTPRMRSVINALLLAGGAEQA